MDELEQEINSIGESINHAEIAADIIEGKSPEAVVIFAATVILALAQDAEYYLEAGMDMTEVLSGIVNFSGVILSQMPEEHYPEAVDALQHLDNAIAMTTKPHE